jgi:hypothetical protein
MALPNAARCSSNLLDWMSTTLKPFTRRLSATQCALHASRNLNLTYKFRLTPVHIILE